MDIAIMKNKDFTTDKNNLVIKYHANGKTIWSKGKIINGLPEGYWEWYRIDQTIKRSGYFQAGEPVGTWTTYDLKGKPYKITTKEKPYGKK
jgi:antitoxin component YwqK of YwqJK toxin-antitoxin module